MKPELKILNFPKQEKPPTAFERFKKKIKSFHIVHDWSEYEVYKEGDLITDGKKTGFYIMQVSQCNICGKAKLNRIDS